MGTKQKLLEIGGKMFEKYGYEGVSVRDVIKAAGANLGAITYHFGSKEAFFCEVVARKIEPMMKMGHTVVATGKGPKEKLRAILETYAFYVMHTEPALKVLFAEALAGGRRLPKAAITAIIWRNKKVIEVLNDGIEEGIFRKCDVECAAWSFFGMLAGYILYRPIITGQKREGAYSEEYVRRIVDTAMDIFLYGVCSSKGRTK
ncbi:MAG: TetR/AcrR family transcriptional regulator [Kiritimatiellae bacterium]|nr:TetR/AcrR family transcriptional regulator [Kiritimatiellia bacterium]MDD5523183.1 TetR/AcrR family transcriptional regulator [Kiritimatiellia bacterium]